MDDKQRIRTVALSRRDEMTADERSRKSLAICRRLERLVEEELALPEHGAGTSGAGCCTGGVSNAGDGGTAGATGGCASGRDGGDGCGVDPHAGDPPRSLRVAVYAAMRSEVALDAFVETAWTRGWAVCFPCMVRDAQDAPSRMAFYQVSSERIDEAREAFLDHPLRCLACDRMADDGYEAVAPEDLDAVAVPLVAFDDRGGRLGYGGGNYDRLLPLLRPDALVVGVAFEEQRVPAVPTEPHDQPLPRIVCA